MSLPAFLLQLFDHGQLRVPTAAPLADSERVVARQVLTEFADTWRQTLPGTAPDFAPAAACWAAETLYRACQCLVFRELDVKSTLAVPLFAGPLRARATEHYSVDLTFRFLPDVWRLARDVASADPLVEALRELAGHWPLSSVGMCAAAPEPLAVILEHRGLRTLYVDRVLARQDQNRLTDPGVTDAVRDAIGLYTELAPWVDRALSPVAVRPTTAQVSGPPARG